MDNVEPFFQLFNHLPGIYFFVKDEQSRLIGGNEALLERLNVSSDEIIGTTDYEYFPSHVADSFIQDDRLVLKTGKPLLNRVAVWYNQQWILDWFIKNKFPLRDSSGKVFGLIGTIQSYEGMRHAHTPFSEVNRTVDHIKTHLHECLSVKNLALVHGISPRQLHRRFRLAFGLSVQQFLTRTRIQAAEDALIKSNRSIAEIALAMGFCDQSAFTRQFLKRTGLTPSKFRQRYSVAPMPPREKKNSR